jgi:galactokinase
MQSLHSTGSLAALIKAALDEFARRFGRPARYLAAAPGRVNLIGEHTDYNDGFVLPMAIDRHVLIAADRPAEETASPQVRLYSAALDRWASFATEEAATPGPADWSNYVRGVFAGFQAAGHRPGPFDAVIHSDLPVGGGLSSSAALDVAAATLLEALAGTRLDPLAKALLCQRAEHDFAGVPCGIMDPCASVMGRAGSLLLLDCRSRTVQLTPLADPDILVLIVNSNVKHALTDGGYAARRRQCEDAARLLGVPALRDVTLEQLERARGRVDDLLYRRARHVVSENARTLQTADALRRGDWDRVGRLMLASHASLRDDFQVSCDELNVLVKLATEAGAIGSRMTGGGFGGCTVTLVRRPSLDAVSRHISDGYLRETGRAASVFVTRPADGARLL